MVKTNIKVSYSNNNDKETVKALYAFEKKLVEIDESFSVDYSCEENPIEDMKNGKCQIAVVDSELLKEYGNEFFAFTTPFYFISAEQSTMTLNSEKFYDLYEDIFEKNLNSKLLGSVYLTSDFMIFTNDKLKDLKTDNLKTPVLSPDEEIMINFFGKNNIKISLEENYENDNENGEIYIKNIEELSDFFSDKETIYIAEMPLRVNSQWVLINNDYWNSLSDIKQNHIKDAVSYFCGMAESERIQEYNNLLFELNKQNINAVFSYCGEIRMQCQTFVKSNVDKINIDLYSEVINIIS